MSQIPPFAAAIIQSTQVQQRSDTDKERTARRLIGQARDSALLGDTFEHQVESSDKPPTAGDDGGSGQGAGYSLSSGEEPPAETPAETDAEESKHEEREQSPHIDIRP